MKSGHFSFLFRNYLQAGKKDRSFFENDGVFFSGFEEEGCRSGKFPFLAAVHFRPDADGTRSPDEHDPLGVTMGMISFLHLAADGNDDLCF